MANDNSLNARRPDDARRRPVGSDELLREQNVERDYGPAGAQALDRPDLVAGADSRDDGESGAAMSPNEAAMAEHDREGEGLRDRARIAATGSPEPMTEQATQAPEGDAGDLGSAGDGGSRAAPTGGEGGDRGDSARRAIRS